MFPYDLQRIARDAMTYTAQRRTSKLPAELRMQIMQACVFYDTPTSESIISVTGLREMAAALFDGGHIQLSDRAVYDVLQESAEQAFLENVMFSFMLYTHHPRMDPIRNLPDSLLAQMRYIQIYLCVPPWKDVYKPKIKELARAWNLAKRHFPSLKTCVLTLELRTTDLGSYLLKEDETAHILTDHDTQFSPELLRKNTHEDKLLGTTIADVLDGFAEKGLATKCFARIVHRQLDTTELDTMDLYTIDGSIAYKTRTRTRTRTAYGPLVSVRRAEGSGLQGGSLGARMLAQMYQLARTGEVLEY